MNRYFAIDIGGTAVKFGLVEPSGRIVSRDQFPTGARETKDNFLQKLTQFCDAFIAQGAQGIGISSLGFANTVTGRFEGGTENLPFLTQCNLPQILTKLYQLPVHLINDASAAALGEMHFGAARDVRNFICLTIGTGLGGAIVLNGQLIDGAHFRAGEFGYWDYTDAEHYLEREVSASHMLEAARARTGDDTLDGITFFRKIREGHTPYRHVLTEQMARLAQMIANLILALDVERVVIGGGISGAKDVLIPVLERAVAAHMPKAFADQYSIVAAECGNDAGILGAVWHFMER